MESGKIVIFDEIWLDGATMVMKAVIGDDFMARHVPQSRYFQISELSLKGYTFSSAEIQELNQKRHLSIRREVVGSSYKPGGS